MSGAPAGRWLRIDPRDNVAVALEAAAPGAEVSVPGATLRTLEPIPTGHKVALVPIAEGERVVKYGAPVGLATRAIAAGAWVHTHNVRTDLSGTLEYSYKPTAAPDLGTGAVAAGRTFLGYKRPDGQVGIRNELWILPTVACVNRLAERLAAELERELPPGVTAAHALTHPHGCGQFGDDLRRTQRVLADFVHHPNAGAVLVVGLGCEYNRVSSFREVVGHTHPGRVEYLVAQEVEDEVEASRALLRRLAEYAGGFRRTEIPLSRLRVGVKCGGSDAFSGITANPLVGAVTDRLVAAGAGVVMTEVPEMFGAEVELLNRAVSRDVFDRGVAMINGTKRYFIDHDQPIYENPAPGNKDGGITTLEEKSLGCTRKGGLAPVTDVLEYAERVRCPGLTLLTSPGYDGVSVTALAAAAVHLILFTTGRGNPLGTLVPTVKISSNSALARRKPHWIDFDAGTLLGGASMLDLADELLDLTVRVASGLAQARNEENGERELVIWKDGVTV